MIFLRKETAPAIKKEVHHKSLGPTSKGRLGLGSADSYGAHMFQCLIDVVVSLFNRKINIGPQFQAEIPRGVGEFISYLRCSFCGNKSSLLVCHVLCVTSYAYFSFVCIISYPQGS